MGGLPPGCCSKPLELPLPGLLSTPLLLPRSTANGEDQAVASAAFRHNSAPVFSLSFEPMPDNLQGRIGSAASAEQIIFLQYADGSAPPSPSCDVTPVRNVSASCS
jgi:hypothetical protein